MKSIKIVLTGGPCGGKTTSIQAIEEEFTELGYHVLIVPEAATILINSGIKPFGNNGLSTYEFQEYVMKTQLYLEDIAEKAAQTIPAKTIIICDRGLLDDKAYITGEEYQKLTKEFHTTPLQLMSRYDLVLHLKTAADGKEEFYTLSNNSARTETIEEALDKDQKTLSAWLGHERLKIIGNDTDFKTKINNVLKEIHCLVDTKYPIERQEKYLVNVNLKDLKNLSPQVLDIEQYFIEKDNIEYLYRKTSTSTDTKYTLITKIDTDINNERITLRRNITEKEYYINQTLTTKKIIKKRYCFPYKNQNFRLDIFQDNLQILEIEETNKTIKRSIPSFIELKEDISNSLEYRNSTLSQKLFEKMKINVKK